MPKEMTHEEMIRCKALIGFALGAIALVLAFTLLL